MQVSAEKVGHEESLRWLLILSNQLDEKHIGP